jgi:hypothetical protein
LGTLSEPNETFSTDQLENYGSRLSWIITSKCLVQQKKSWNSLVQRHTLGGTQQRIVTLQERMMKVVARVSTMQLLCSAQGQAVDPQELLVPLIFTEMWLFFTVQPKVWWRWQANNSGGPQHAHLIMNVIKLSFNGCGLL